MRRMSSVYLLRKIFILALLMTVVLFVFIWSNTGKSSDIDVIQQSLVAIDPSIPLNVKNRLCSAKLEDERPYMGNQTDLKMIYFVTPTFPRPVQVPELTRLSHTLMHVPRIHWIVADDQPICSEPVLDILKRTGLPYTHISSPSPFAYKVKNFPKGVANRLASLAWIRENVHEGILYFGDDDNTFDLRLFQEIRRTKRVAMLPVGLLSGYGVSAPVVSNGKVVAFYEAWIGGRTFPVDMAGFAVNIEHISPSATMPYFLGHEEDGFLVSLGLKLEDIEPLADNCSKIYVWHTRTENFKKPNVKFNISKLEPKTKFRAFANLLKETVKLGMVNITPSSGTKIRVVRNNTSYDILKESL